MKRDRTMPFLAMQLVAAVLAILASIALIAPSPAFAQGKVFSDSANAASGEINIVRVGYCDQPGLLTREADGSFTGYTFDYLMRIAQYTGWSYEFIPVQGSTEHERTTNLGIMLDQAYVDIAGAITRDGTYSKALEYSHSSYGVSPINQQPFYFAAPPGARVVMDLVDKAMLRLELEDPTLQTLLFSRYFSLSGEGYQSAKEAGDAGLTAGDNASIANADTISDAANEQTAHEKRVGGFVLNNLAIILLIVCAVLVVAMVFLVLYLQTRGRIARSIHEDNLRFQKLFSLTNEQLFEYLIKTDTLILSNNHGKGPINLADRKDWERTDSRFCSKARAKSL